MNTLKIDDFDAWLASAMRPSALVELAVLVAIALMAWLMVWLARRAMRPVVAARGADVGDAVDAGDTAAVSSAQSPSILFGTSILDGVLFPLVLLCLAFAAKVILNHWVPPVIFKVVIPVVVSLLAIRLGVKVLQAAFRDAPVVRFLEQSISWVAWMAVALWLTGLLPLMLDELDQISWKVGGAKLTVRNMIEGALTAGAVLLVTLWISSAIEARLLREATGAELSLRKAVSNASRASLMFFGLLLALSAVGIDLTALSVLGGAIGVGVGLGLQKLAANYVSGFVILAERSMRIGDNVRVDGFEGRITHINARYSVIRSLTGRESIVPNEMLITNRVENLSLADSQVLQTSLITVGYESDAALVMRLLLQATTTQARVLTDPAPSVALSDFGADGLQFTVLYWICDPENGILGLRSAINLEILRLLREHQIDIPYPQRVVHMRASGATAPQPGNSDSPVPVFR